MKKFKVTSYSCLGDGSTPAICIDIEAASVQYEDNGLVVFKKKMTDPPVGIFDVGKVWIREQE